MKIIEYLRLPSPPPFKPHLVWGFLFNQFLWRRVFFVETLIFIRKRDMKKRKQELTKCSNPSCGIEFLKDSSEIKRNKKIDRKNYCSLSCSGQMNNNHLRSYVQENVKYLLAVCNNGRDKYTGLREHYRRIKKRKHIYDVTLDDLLEIWENQGGICVYSGVKLLHPNEGGNNLNTASLDRIDSKLGYVKGNLQFVSIICNQAKNNLSHEEMMEFIKMICNYQSGK
jgi:hypothetical protein